MTIGTLLALQFTSRSRRLEDWEDIEDMDDARLDAIPTEMLEAPDCHMADRVCRSRAHTH